MKNRYLSKTLIVLCAGALLAGCGNSGANSESSSSTSSAEVTTSTSSAGESQVADTSEKAEEEEVGWEGMISIPGANVADGEYEITVDSSSSMFNITKCTLEVKGGEMTAHMTMGGTGYLYLFMGTGEEASKVAESNYIPFEEQGDVHVYSVPVAALDEKTAVAAFSKKKEKWYDRTLVFNAAGVAKANGLVKGGFENAASLNLSDGTYTCGVSLIGGTGRSSISSPCEITVADGKMTAKIQWSSDKYDYMLVDDEKYEPVNTEGNSEFEIPILGVGYPSPVIADTTAMGSPHEISYLLLFDKDSLK